MIVIYIIHSLSLNKSEESYDVTLINHDSEEHNGDENSWEPIGHTGKHSFSYDRSNHLQ